MNGKNDMTGSTGGSFTMSFGGDTPGTPSPQAGPLTGLSPEASAQAGGPVKDISTAEFKAEVLDASRQQPVLVDFWAPWCGPCKQLAPALEKVVAESRGAVRLVKMNIDDHPEVAGQMGIQSIPAVVAFVDGRPADAFMGAQPESEIRRFVEKLAKAGGPSPVDEALDQAEELAGQGAAAEAANLFAAVLQQEPDNARALAGMGTLYLDNSDLERAKAVLDSIPAEKMADPKVASLKAAIDLAEQAGELGDAAQLQARLDNNPDDHQARFDLALLHNHAGRREEAAAELLEIVRRNREWQEDGARNQLLQFFEAWGPTDPATKQARRSLSSLLFA